MSKLELFKHKYQEILKVNEEICVVRRTKRNFVIIFKDGEKGMMTMVLTLDFLS